MRAWRYLGYAAVFKLAMMVGVGACALLGIEPWWAGVQREFRMAAMEPIPRQTVEGDRDALTPPVRVVNTGDNYLTLTRGVPTGTDPMPPNMCVLANRSDETVYFRVDDRGVPMDFDDYRSPLSDVRFDAAPGKAIALPPGRQYGFTLQLRRTDPLNLPLRYYTESRQERWVMFNL